MRLRRYLQQVLEQRDAPADQRGEDPGLARMFRRCPYHANVMNRLEAESNKIACNAGEANVAMLLLRLQKPAL